MRLFYIFRQICCWNFINFDENKNILLIIILSKFGFICLDFKRWAHFTSPCFWLHLGIIAILWLGNVFWDFLFLLFWYNKCTVWQLYKNQKEDIQKWMTIIIVSLTKLRLHITNWNCKHHIVFAKKYQRMVFYNEFKVEVGKILRELCNWKQVKIIEAEVCPDHIHILI